MQRASLEVSRASDIHPKVGRHMLPLWYAVVWPISLSRWVLLYFIWSTNGWLVLGISWAIPFALSTFAPVPFRHFLRIFHVKVAHDLAKRITGNADLGEGEHAMQLLNIVSSAEKRFNSLATEGEHINGSVGHRKMRSEVDINSPNWAAPSPLTRLFPLLIAAYAWQVQGLFWAFVIAVLYLAALAFCNISFMSKYMDSSADHIRVFQRIKWALFIVTMIGIAFSGATIGRIPQTRGTSADPYFMRDGLFFDRNTKALYSGPFVNTWPNGNLRLSGSIKEGLRVGHWIDCDSNGDRAEGECVNGLMQGQWSEVDSKGLLRKLGEYDYGRKSGEWQEWDIDSRLQLVEYRNGVPLSRRDVR